MTEDQKALGLLKQWQRDRTTATQDKLFTALKLDLDGAEYRITVEKPEDFDAENATMEQVKALPFVLTRRIEDQSEEVYRTHIGCCMGCMALKLTKAAIRDTEDRTQPKPETKPNPKSPWAQ